MLLKGVTQHVGSSFLCSYSADFTMDVIARTGFGLEMDSQTGQSGQNEFVTMAKRSMDVMLNNPVIIITSKTLVSSKYDELFVTGDV